MPEGDTIHKVALYLRPRLVGESLQPPPKPLPPSVATLSGDRVQSVSAVGKHLIIATDLRSLQVHLGMRGTWHHYRRRERWKVSESQARVVLTARCGVLVCFRAPQVTVRLRKQSNPPSSVGRLGPDILAPDVDFPGLVRRARRFSAASPLIIDMLLDQQIACGIGNARFKLQIKNVMIFDPIRANGSLYKELRHGWDQLDLSFLPENLDRKKKSKIANKFKNFVIFDE